MPVSYLKTLAEALTYMLLKMSIISSRGTCCLRVKWKTFEILIQEVKGKVLGRICDRVPNFSLRIRFGEKDLAFACRRGRGLL